jgi:chitodextrinase
VARDAAGNSSSSSVTVTTNVADTTAPSAPTGLIATALSSSQVNLSWSPSTDNVGVAGYQIFRNGAQVATSSETSYSDSGLMASTTYTHAVAAFDQAGSVSPQSASSSATTQSVSTSSVTIFTTQVPDGSASDGASTFYELGTRFMASASGQITAIRFYKSASESGTHVGHIWDAAGISSPPSRLPTRQLPGGRNSKSRRYQSRRTRRMSSRSTPRIPISPTPTLACRRRSRTDLFRQRPELTACTELRELSPTNSYESTNYFRDVRFVVNGGN